MDTCTSTTTTATPTSVPATKGSGPIQVRVTGRSLVLVAGLPGAGKSTLLRSLDRRPGVVLLDSDTHRVVLRRLLPDGVPYRLVRPWVHVLHCLTIVHASLGRESTVVVHVVASSRPARRALTGLARLSRRTATLVWLDVSAAEALSGQRQRGRVTRARPFARHTRRTEQISNHLRHGTLDERWETTMAVTRAAAQEGLRIRNTFEA